MSLSVGRQHESPIRERRRSPPPRRRRSPESHREREREISPPPASHRSSHKSRKSPPLEEKRKHSRSRSPPPSHSRVKPSSSSRERISSIDRRGDKKGGSPSSSSRSRHRRSPSNSPTDRDHRARRHSSGSPPRVSKSRGREEVPRLQGDDHRGENDSVAMMKAAEEALEAKKKEEPSFELSGKLAAETNRVRGVTLLHSEPADARKPEIRWRLYVFKAGEVLNEPLYIHRQTCYLLGRERRVADIPTDHPSCSKQHAVIQFRQVEKEQPDGMLKKQVRPYLLDLGSTNGTFLNENRIDPQRYYELFEKDTIKFGNSSREYVILHENSA